MVLAEVSIVKYLTKEKQPSCLRLKHREIVVVNGSWQIEAGNDR